jgi:hypothetical protein
LEPWPHQVRALDLTLAAIARGERRIVEDVPYERLIPEPERVEA